MQEKNIIKFNNIPNLFDTELLNNLIYSYVKINGYMIKKTYFNFVSKEELLFINREFLNHNYHTDIISFDYSNNKSIEADIYLSMWAIENSAKKEGQTTENETLRVIAHGILHCMGQNDKTVKQKKLMRTKEEEFIKMFHVKQNSYV